MRSPPCSCHSHWGCTQRDYTGWQEGAAGAEGPFPTHVRERHLGPDAGSSIIFHRGILSGLVHGHQAAGWPRSNPSSFACCLQGRKGSWTCRGCCALPNHQHCALHRPQFAVMSLRALQRGNLTADGLPTGFAAQKTSGWVRITTGSSTLLLAWLAANSWSRNRSS